MTGELRQLLVTAVGSGCALTSCDFAAQAGSWQSPRLGSVLWSAHLSSPPSLMAWVCWNEHSKTSHLLG